MIQITLQFHSLTPHLAFIGLIIVRIA